MNKVKSILVTLAVILSAVACEKKMPGEPPVEYLDVNVSNISGSWELVEWNGAPLQSGTYVFLNIIRKDWTYQMWQNVDSFQDVPHRLPAASIWMWIRLWVQSSEVIMTMIQETGRIAISSRILLKTA